MSELENADMLRVTPGQRWPGLAEEMSPGYYTLEETEKQARAKGMDEEVLSQWLKKLQNPWPF